VNDYLDVLYDYMIIIVDKFHLSDTRKMQRCLGKLEEWDKVALERGLIVDE
jgi:hypothetical protein